MKQIEGDLLTPLKVGDEVRGFARGNWVTFQGTVEYITVSQQPMGVKRADELAVVRITAPPYLRGVVELWRFRAC
jgi:hypothetical protein